MDLSEQDLKKIKSLHVMLKIISIRFHMNLKKKIFQMRLYGFTAGC